MDEVKGSNPLCSTTRTHALLLWRVFIFCTFVCVCFYYTILHVLRPEAATINTMRIITSSRFYKTLEKLSIGRLVRIFVISGILLGMSSSYLWYSRLYLNDERVFWMAIENSMSTPSVTRTLIDGGTGNQVVQQQQSFFSPQQYMLSRVTFDQRSSTVETSVETEGMTFPDAQYSRYTKFTTNQKNADGSDADINEYLNRWEGDTFVGDELEDARLNYMSELVTLVIFGNFDPEFRRDVIHQLQTSDVYRISNEAITQDTIEGEDVTIYPVSVGLKKYAELLFNAFKHAGYGEFPALNPESYQDDARIPVTIAVNSRTHTVANIKFGSREENYGAYGVVKPVERPETEFNSGELESEVQKALQDII